jgi:xylan 1,4-beta-xylosidase
VYHGDENGYRTLGRQVLLEPVRWSADGWPIAMGGDLSRALSMPKSTRQPLPAPALSDDFATSKLGVQWKFHQPARDELQRVRFDAGSLVVGGKGTGPADCSPLTFSASDRAYEVEVSVEAGDAAIGGLLLFYNERVFFGIGFDGKALRTYAYGERHDWLRLDLAASRVLIRITNDHHIVTLHTSTDGGAWSRHPWQLEVSGAHQNVLGGFLSLRPALFSCGAGGVRFRDFRYRGLA